MKRTLLTVSFLLLIAGLGYYASSYFNRGREDQLKEAFVHYVNGEKSKSIGERQDSFNAALGIYSTLEKQYNPIYGNGKLYYNIGNSYFQLGEYPMAALYYHRSLKLMPRNDKVKQNLSHTLKKLGIESKSEDSVFKKVFFFYHLLSLPERLQLFFFITLTALLLGSLYIWYRNLWLNRLSIFASFLSLIMLITLAYSFYFSPIEGVIIRSTGLYRDAGFQYAKVEEQPILSGQKVAVVDVLDEGKWLKIMTPEGRLGYVPDEAIRII